MNTPKTVRVYGNNWTKEYAENIKKNIKKQNLSDLEEEILERWYLYVNNALDMYKGMESGKLELSLNPATIPGFIGLMMCYGAFEIDLEERKKRFINWDEKLQVNNKEGDYLGEAGFVKKSNELHTKHKDKLRQFLLKTVLESNTITNDEEFGNMVNETVNRELNELIKNRPKTQTNITGPRCILAYDDEGHQNVIKKTDVIVDKTIDLKIFMESYLDNKRAKKRAKKRKYNKKKKMRK